MWIFGVCDWIDLCSELFRFVCYLIIQKLAYSCGSISWDIVLSANFMVLLTPLADFGNLHNRNNYQVYVLMAAYKSRNNLLFSVFVFFSHLIKRHTFQLICLEQWQNRQYFWWSNYFGRFHSAGGSPTIVLSGKHVEYCSKWPCSKQIW